ncbi:hypothetical protein CANARDRAFT_178488, partial [[Candida] arabinofermentans NRRL YB-2248]
SKSKTIKTPGTNTLRVSVACDRCRKKKIRCFYDDEGEDESMESTDRYSPHGSESDTDGKRQCSNCKAVGLDCIFTDKLARKAFPRGYTESLEERVRELEFQNKKMKKLLSLKEQQQRMDPPSELKPAVDRSYTKEKNQEPDNGLKLNDENLNLLNNQKGIKSVEEHLHDETCNCGNFPHSVHNRPVSIAGSVDIDKGELSDDDASLYSASFSDNFHYTKNADDLRNRYGYNSFEQVNAPGAAAAISLQNKLRTKNFLNLASLIATSIPRSTEETLFIPTLLAKIVSVHGFNSKAPFLTARSIALLKEAYNEQNRYNQFPITFKSVNFNQLSQQDSIQFFQNLNLPNHMNLDLCITLFFDTWNTTTPILNKTIFMTNYLKFNKSREQNFMDGAMYGLEKFGEMLIIITTLVMLSQERNNINNNEQDKNSSNSEILQFYDHLIKQFIQSNLNSICSIPSLQTTTMELLFCLTTGDLNTSYELRGKMITMSQQLRLHRCPSAVLGSSGSNVSKLQQGERRILFWCIYTLDSFSALILGVPRLLKDYEIECALPSSSSTEEKGDDTDKINLITFNNTQLSLVGKVRDSALSVMRYAKVLGSIVDTIFRRSNTNSHNNNGGFKKTSVDESTSLILEDMLDSWRRELSSNINIDVDSNGNFKTSDFEKMNETQLTLLYLYYQAKALIYMPLMATETINSKNSASYITIQQSATALLTITKVLNSPKYNFYHLPLPINASRQKARFVLLAAKGSLEYTRGGALFQDSKNLLTFITNDLKFETEIGLLGCLSVNCMYHLENAIEAILLQPKLNPKESKKKTLFSPLRLSSATSKTGDTIKVKKEDDVAINDIFSSSSSLTTSTKHQTLQTHMRQSQQEQQEQRDQRDQQPQQPQQPQRPQRPQQPQQPQQQQQQQQQQVQSDAVNSYTDLLMLNDFGVDASLGLPLLDFEFDD